MSKEVNTKIDFPPIPRKCSNVTFELKSVADSFKIPLNSIDFDISNVATFIRIVPENHTNIDYDWEEADLGMLLELKKEQYLAKKEVEIKQVYEILIKPYKKEDDFFLDVSFAANKTLSKVVAIIKKSSILPNSLTLAQRLLVELNKKKLRLGIFINLFDDEMLLGIEEIVGHIREFGSLKQDFKITVCSSLEPIWPVNDELRFLYSEKVKKSSTTENGHIDFSKRDFAVPVDIDEVIIEYIKPKEGKPGRTCKGEYVIPPLPNIRNVPTFNYDKDSIYVVETEDAILYKSKIRGFVEKVGNLFRVKEELNVDKIDFKTTGSIESSIDLGLTISVKLEDYTEDSISAGMRVECAKLNIKGSVGSGAIVKADSAYIEGMTHGTSRIEAKEAFIKVNKGTLIAKIANIDTLEGGVVRAEKVNVHKVIGGEIYANEVNIDFCYSNAYIAATKLIKIKQVYGDNNKFVIDPEIFGELGDKIQSIKNALLKLSIEYTDLQKSYEVKSKFINENINTIKAVKQKLAELQKQNIEPNKGLLARINDFYNTIEELKKGTEELNKKREKKLELEAELDKLQNGIFSAQIIHEGVWSGLNEIIFNTISPKKSISRVPRGAEKVFMLKEEIDDFVIKVTS